MKNHNIKDVEIRPASAQDIKLFYPSGAPRTSYSWLVLYRGAPACLAGLIVERGGCIAYSEMKACSASKRTIWRTARALMGIIADLGLPMHTACAKMDTRAQAFVTRLGFKGARNFQGVEFFTWK